MKFFCPKKRKTPPEGGVLAAGIRKSTFSDVRDYCHYCGNRHLLRCCGPLHR
jgi:hypothetical protein